MKESEAKSKVCPFRAMWGEDRNGGDYYNEGFCIASDCMMWVEHNQATAEFKVDKEGHCGLIK